MINENMPRKKKKSPIFRKFLIDYVRVQITFLDSLCNSATGGQSKGLIFFKLSDDRDVWRGMAANVCS